MKRLLGAAVLFLGLAAGAFAQNTPTGSFQGDAAGQADTSGAVTGLPGVDAPTTNSAGAGAGVGGGVDNCGADTSMQGTGTAGSSGVAGIGATRSAGATGELDNC